MKIVCIYSVGYVVSSGNILPNYSDVPFGLAYVATVLRKAGHDVSVLVLSRQSDIRQAFESLGTAPQLVCLTSVASQYGFITDIAKTSKGRWPHARIILGGPHASLSAEVVMQNPLIDAVCIGEGENSVIGYAAGREVVTGNIWYRDASGAVRRGQQDEYIQDLDALVFPDRTMWDRWVTDRSIHAVSVGRGCYNNCSYCSNHALRNLQTGRYQRFRSPESIVSEIRFILQGYPETKTVYLEAETLSVDPEYTIRLCDALTGLNATLPSKLSFVANFSPTRRFLASDELVDKLVGANFGFINLGLESGSRRIRSEIMKRPPYENSEIIAFCGRCKRASLPVRLFVLMGTPGETIEDHRKTVECVRECRPSSVNLSIFYPYPGTGLHKLALTSGLLTGREAVSGVERQRAVLDLPGFPRKQIDREYLLFFYRAFKGRMGMKTILIETLRNFLGMHPGLKKIAVKTLSTFKRV
ncbi:MAG: hypothetical protein A2583_14365 [Bdellovibrionales bacterium RIFOXYD1_FULL_53_11]|nr:MAG: hypothetical protein A2583_14365 [Bdellovibrionales bacterium RIFOXYD1_FULL_53_11]